MRLFSSRIIEDVSPLRALIFVLQNIIFIVIFVLTFCVQEGADGFLQYAVDGERKPAAKIYLEKIK